MSWGDEISKIIGVFGALAIPLGIGALLIAMALMIIFVSLPKEQTDYSVCINACRVSSEQKDYCFSECNQIFLNQESLCASKREIVKK